MTKMLMRVTLGIYLQLINVVNISAKPEAFQTVLNKVFEYKLVILGNTTNTLTTTAEFEDECID